MDKILNVLIPIRNFFVAEPERFCKEARHLTKKFKRVMYETEIEKKNAHYCDMVGAYERLEESFSSPKISREEYVELLANHVKKFKPKSLYTRIKNPEIFDWTDAKRTNVSHVIKVLNEIIDKKEKEKNKKRNTRTRV